MNKRTYRNLKNCGFIGAMTLFCVIALSSCNPAKRLADDEVFLRKQSIKVHDSPVTKEEVSNVLRLRSNRKILFVRFHLGLYNLPNPDKLEKTWTRKSARKNHRIEKKIAKGKELSYEKIKEIRSDTTGWRDWLRRIGEPPATMDSIRLENSLQQIQTYLSTEGFFNSEVESEVKYTRKGKRAKIKYDIYPNDPYVIRNIDYIIDDPGIETKLGAIKNLATVKPGDRFSVDMLDDERDMIANYLNNRGYYTFTKDYITYLADSALNSNQVDVSMQFRNVKTVNAQDSIVYVPHKSFFLGKSNVFVDVDPYVGEQATDSISYRGLSIFYNKELKIKPDLLFYLIQFHEGETYSKDYVNLTYRRFSKLPYFNSTSIRMEERVGGNVNILDPYIVINTTKKKSVSVDGNVTHTDGLFGLSSSLKFSDRNVLGQAERAEFKIVGALEAQNSLTETSGTEEISGGNVSRSVTFNTFEIGPEFNLYFYRWFPFSTESFRKTSEPISSISAGFSFQQRPDYTRQLYKFRYGVNLSLNQDKGLSLGWDIWELSAIRISKSDAFQALLDDLNDDYLSNSYQNHLLSLMRANLNLNTQKSSRQRQYLFNRIGFEMSGILPYFGMDLSNRQRDETGSFIIEGIRYAHFVKMEDDFRWFKNFDEKNSVAFRLHSGVGIPLKNLNVLPFEKNYFAGGSNDNRAWQPRTLGPGSFRDSTDAVTYDNIGELKLISSLEYRFEMTETLHGALFVDAGNVWFLQDNTDKPNGSFRKEEFISEIAIGSGFGLRLDFEYFLIRFDIGWQIKDPAKIKGERWFWEPKDEYIQYLQSINEQYRTEINFNLGIGYPF